MQRRGAVVVAGHDVGAGGDQRFHGCGIRVGGGQVQGRRTLRCAHFALFRVGLEQAANVVAVAGSGRIVDRLVVALYLGKRRKGETGSEKQGEQALHAGIRKWLIW